MLDRKTDSHIRSRAPLLSLDYGTDEQICESALAVSERGMRFISRWNFSIGTQLAVACVYEIRG
jgi:phosphatidylserine/phosphatidylglycerophosphate/cardiolipin synthase-like enzyme